MSGHRPIGSLLISLAWASVGLAGWKDDVGYTALSARLASGTPTGSGVSVTQVESFEGTCYLPDTSNAEFSGKTIQPMDGASCVSGHATTVGGYYYGLSSSISPGVTPIFAYESTQWMSGFLRRDSAFAPRTETGWGQNHSWTWTLNMASEDMDVLRRLDLVIERDGVVVAAGVSNGAASAMPTLLASGYNLLAVGLTNGNSSHGPAPIDVSGRVKPDIVAPASETSWATPMVASASALLLDEANWAGTLTGLAPAERKVAKSLVVKALLMAGATKSEFADWRKGFAIPSTDGRVPLDYRYGAGELNVDNSHRILSSAEQNASSSQDVGTTGWDYGSVAPGSNQYYFFAIPNYRCADSVSVLVTWNRHITVGSGDPATLTASLANVDLRLYGASGYSIGTQLDQSVSTIDNVEHIFLPSLPAGRYALVLNSNSAAKYAMAWDVHLVPPSQQISIIAQPQDQSVLAGGTATFVAAASGDNLSYEWHGKNGPLTSAGRISGAGTDTLQIAGVQAADTDAGPYYCVISACDAAPATSASANLTVTFCSIQGWSSVRTHGSGLGELPLEATGDPVNGWSIIEPRRHTGQPAPNVDGTQTLVASFSGDVTACYVASGALTVTPAVSSATHSLVGGGTQLRIVLTGTDAGTKYTVDISQVVGCLASGQSKTAALRVCPGNVNLDLKTDLIDMVLTKSRSAQAVLPDNVRFDVNLDGKVNLIDLVLVKSLNGTPCPN